VITPTQIKCSCKEKKCPVHAKCCFLPTEVYPDKDGKVHLLFVGQGGGKDERKKKRPFIGRAGERIRQQAVAARRRIGYFGVAFSNTIRDSPEGNRPPESDELKMCLPHLYKDIKYLKEKFGLRAVVPLGASSLRALVPECSLAGIGSMHGKLFYVKNDIFGVVAMVPTYHPASLLYSGIRFSEKHMDQKDATIVEDILTAYKSQPFEDSALNVEDLLEAGVL